MLHKQVYGVIVRPIVTEKTSALKAEANKIVFEVQKTANKIDVKTAVEIIKHHLSLPVLAEELTSWIPLQSF